ncbi:MAG: insulinase family protein [Bacteroidia bacterium]|nr:insulinase family protein [Bacteroidia bacterium]
MIHEFNNGIRLIYFQAATEVSHLGVMVKTGSRDELENENGLAHFIEHCIFKGTSKRKTVHILSRMDSVGGELNAYTTKEETTIYTSFLNEFFPRAVDLLSDILLNSTFPEKEIEKEKAVIRDEINMYKDNPSEDIFDCFDEHIFPDHPLGRNILGTVSSLKSFKQSHLRDFIRRNFSNSELVVSYVGNLPFNKVVKQVEQAFESADFSGNVAGRVAPKAGNLEKKVVKKKLNQVHQVIGKASYDLFHPNRLAFTLVNNILGGQGMNSRLNLNIREKYGFCYAIDSSFHAYSDSGIFNLYFATDAKYYPKTRELVLRELRKFVEKPLTDNQVNQAKIQLKGQLALSQQNLQNRMLANAKSVILFNEPNPLAKTWREVTALTASQLNDASEQMFGDSEYMELVFE